ncbi:hypothetical protein HPB47_004274, partial [Ixodes persulcatus]
MGVGLSCGAIESSSPRFPEKWLFDALCYQILALQTCDRALYDSVVVLPGFVDEEKESAVSTQLPRPPRLTPSSAQRNYADTVRLLYSARDAKIREPRLSPTLSQELEDVRSANEHFLRIRTTARCRVPRTRVVHVKEFYSDPSKEYLPRCTVLHRCGDDSGCCDNEQYECVPRTMQEVTLHFY